MSKAQDSKKEAKKPAAKTAKEKQEAKKAKKAENARKEFWLELLITSQKNQAKDTPFSLFINRFLQNSFSTQVAHA